jgi:hypothetical protein
MQNVTIATQRAGVVELVDTQVSDACGGNPVEVQVLSSAYIHSFCLPTTTQREYNSFILFQPPSAVNNASITVGEKNAFF